MDSDENNQTFMIAFGPRFNSYSTYHDEVYPNILEIRSAKDSMPLLKKMTLKKYYRNNEVLYQLFVEKVFFVRNNKIFILYRAVPDGKSYHDPSKDMFIYELREI